MNGCQYLYRDEYAGDYDCLANTILDCDQCKYGVGTRNPLAKCNQIKDEVNRDKRTGNKELPVT